MVRFAIPAVTIGSDLAFRHFMADDYRASQTSIDATAGQLEAPSAPAVPDNKGLIDRFKGLLASIEQATEHVVKLMAIFLLQTLVIPVVLLWMLYRIAGSAFRIREYRA
jgi:hypothetical protein